MASDSAFTGSVPALYHLHLGPLLFEPYADDLARRLTALRPKHVLETAAGTGIVTEAIARALPDTRIEATDLNKAMLDVAEARIASPNLHFRAVDAQLLPYADGTFDAVVCQFGAMFFPDRVGAYREARRVLKPGGSFLFNVWDSLERNPASAAVAAAVAAVFPEDPPTFFSRIPFGYHDEATVQADLRAAGFTAIEHEIVAAGGRIGAPAEAATGLCSGTPLGAEIAARDPSRLHAAIAAATQALERVAEEGNMTPLSAHVFTAHG
jgi:ubiquinone/menaquinone biosynthesis C-methylase UbiE